MKTPIKIGTRSSQLALYQANLVAKMLNENGVQTQIVEVSTEGDVNLTDPIYQMGISGVFTKTLDIALLKNQIDIAVHSLKDVPTTLPKGLKLLAVLERGDHRDILKTKGKVNFEKEIVVGTGSIRRKAQWLNQYPHHQIEPLRGNVNSRLKKLETNENWSGAIFAKAGLERVELNDENSVVLDWMVPAPAQGAICVASRESDDEELLKIIRQILNHKETEMTTYVERDFMKTIEAGCSSPIGAFAEIVDDEIHFEGLFISFDGKEKAVVKKVGSIKEYDFLGKECANILYNQNRELINEVKMILNKDNE